MPVTRLPPGRHKLTREEVRESQLLRLRTAAAEALAELGYGRITTTAVAQRAGVSTATLYRHHGDLWGCLLDGYQAGAEELRKRLQTAGRGEGGPEAAIAAALHFLSTSRSLAVLLCAEPPAEATELWAARRELVAELARMFSSPHDGEPGGSREQHLSSATLALVANRARRGEDLASLAPVLAARLSPAARD